MILAVGELRAGTGAIPKGPDVLILKPNLLFKGGDIKIMTGDTDDPTVVAKDAEAGTFYMQKGGTGTPYRKLDNGTTTTWGFFVSTVSGSGTDDFVPHWDGTNTGFLKDSFLSITDTGVASGLIQFNLENLRLDGNTLSTTSGDLVLAPAGEVTLPFLTGDLPLVLNAANEVVTATISLVSGVNSILPIANGGTNSGVALLNTGIMVASGGSIIEVPTIPFASSSGILPIAQGGTNSGVALLNTGIMVASGGQIIEVPTIEFASVANHRPLTTLNPTEIWFGGLTGLASSSPDLTYDDVTDILNASATVQIDGVLDMRNDSPIRLFEQAGNGTALIAIQTSGSLAASYTITLPDDGGLTGQVLTTDGSGTTTWQTPAASSASSTLDSAWGGGVPIIVGSVAQVASDDATHVLISNAIASATGLGIDRITFLTGTFIENVSATSPIQLVGSGFNTIIQGDIEMVDDSGIERLKIDGNLDIYGEDGTYINVQQSSGNRVTQPFFGANYIRIRRKP